MRSEDKEHIVEALILTIIISSLTVFFAIVSDALLLKLEFLLLIRRVLSIMIIVSGSIFTIAQFVEIAKALKK